MTLLNTTLQIVRGVFKAPGDAFSAENDLFILELQDPAGFSLQVDGWSPNLPALKGGGTWAESAIADGRIPLAQSVGNVTETMRLTMANGDLQQRFAIFKKLGQMRQSVIDFWDGTAQIDPIYIRWHAAIGKGEQYALILNMEVAQDSDIFNPEQSWDITLTIEREPYWRGIWPGGNPKEWTLGVVRGLVRGQAGYQTTNMDLTADSDHFLFETISNKFEWKAASAGDQALFTTKNYIDISASSVPGDAPALLEIAVVNSSTTRALSELYIAHSTKETSKINHAGETEVAAYVLAAGDADAATGWTKTAGTASTGIRSNNSDSLFYYTLRTLTIVSSSTLTWSNGSPNILLLDRELLRGTFMIFMRGATNGATGDMTAHIVVQENENAIINEYQPSFILPEINLQASSEFYPLHYMGTVTIPLSGRSTVSLKGYGRQIHEDPSGNLEIQFVLSNTVAASRTFQLLDLILVPIDEGINHIVLQSPTYDISGPTGKTVIDGTGYLTRGIPGVRAASYITTITSGGEAVEVRGAPLMLKPGVNQHLYFLAGVGTPIYPPDETLTVRANIVPRWAGIRDV